MSHYVIDSYCRKKERDLIEEGSSMVSAVKLSIWEPSTAKPLRTFGP